MIEAIGFLPVIIVWVYLMCSNNCNEPSKPTGNSFAELEAYYSGVRNE